MAGRALPLLIVFLALTSSRAGAGYAHRWQWTGFPPVGAEVGAADDPDLIPPTPGSHRNPVRGAAVPQVGRTASLIISLVFFAGIALLLYKLPER